MDLGAPADVDLGAPADVDLGAPAGVDLGALADVDLGAPLDRFIDWFNIGFYGETARLDPQEGYVAPPLDGIWATAPFLHNGSVPTLEALLDSSKRPTYWRVQLGLDQESMGLPHEDATADESRSFFVYDTTEPGYGNEGHTYGDVLSDAQRRDLLEYLKTRHRTRNPGKRISRAPGPRRETRPLRGSALDSAHDSGPPGRGRTRT